MAVNPVILILVVVAAAIVAERATAATYRVGDSSGWQVPTGGFNYSNWAAQQNFVAGDILVFNFITGQHTVAKVTQDAYNNCRIANPIEDKTNGPANYTLTSGPSYFLCTITNHCSQGQKLQVNAASSSGSPPNSSPGPDSSPTTTPPGTSQPAPPPSSATPTAVAASSLIFLSIFMAFFS